MGTENSDDLDAVPDEWARTFFDEGFEETFRLRGAYCSTQDDLDALCSTAMPHGHGTRVLDVACGFGRHAGSLTERGCRVVGIDASPQQIAQARQLYPQTRFVVADMRQPPPGPYDVVLNLWTSFGLLPTRADDLAALTAWRKVLAPGGILIMDLTTRERAEHLNRKGRELTSTKRVTHEGVTTEARYDWAEGISYVRYSRDGWSRPSRTRLYSRPELELALREAGFAAVSLWGDFQLGPIDPAKRTVVIAGTEASALPPAPHPADPGMSAPGRP